MFSEGSESVHTTTELLSQTTQVIIVTSRASVSATRLASRGQFKCVVFSGVLLLVLVFEDEVPAFD
jgi:hypothetical protein